MVLTTDYAIALKPVVRAVVDTTEKQGTRYWSQIFNSLSTQYAYEDDLKIFGLGAASQTGEGELITYQDPQSHYTYRYTVIKFSQGFRISEESMEDYKVNVIKAPMGRLTYSLIQAKEQHHANILINAFNDVATWQYGDGEPLCSTAHPLGAGGSTSNQLATNSDLSPGSLQDSLRLMRYTVDDRNFPFEVIPRNLIVAPDNMFVAMELLQSINKPQTADNDKNVVTNYNLGLIVDPYLSDGDAWWIQADRHTMNSFARRAPYYDTGIDFDTRSLKFVGLERYIAGVTDWRGIVGTPGA